MADFTFESGGGVDDAVRIIFAGEEVFCAKEYAVDVAYLQQPNTFSVTIGSGATALSMMKRFPKNTPFSVQVGPVPSFSGWTDGISRSSNRATELQITGRDAMARLVDDDIQHDKSFTNATWEELARYAIEGSGIPRGEYELTMDDVAHRKAVTGTPIVEKVSEKKQAKVSEIYAFEPNANSGLTPQQIDDVRAYDYAPTYEVTYNKIKGYRSDNPIRAKAGDSWYNFSKAKFERGGIFLRSTVPTAPFKYAFLLAVPRGYQAPLYGIINQRGAARNANVVNCFQPKLKDTAAGRRAHYIVVGRAGGGKDGRQRVRGQFDDPEMIAAGYTSHRVKVDETVKSSEHAEFIARKLCAEDRRNNRSFSYSVRGHTLPILSSPGKLAVIVPDTVIYLRDDEHGMEGNFWIERVSYRAGEQGRTTEMTLMLPEDLVFGDGDFSRAVVNKKRILGRKGGPV